MSHGDLSRGEWLRFKRRVDNELARDPRYPTPVPARFKTVRNELDAYDRNTVLIYEAVQRVQRRQVEERDAKRAELRAYHRVRAAAFR